MQPAHRYEVIRRRYDLAQRMIVRGARTTTVTRWTGLSEYRVQQIGRRYASTRGTERRGKSPYSPRYFGRSPQIEAESLAFVYLAIVVGVIPDKMSVEAREQLPDLQRGERLLEAFECYVWLVRSAHLSLERAISLLYAFVGGGQLFLRHCEECDDVMLTQRSARSIRCPFCRRMPTGADLSAGAATRVAALRASDP